MGRKIIQVPPDQIAALLTQGQQWGEELTLHVAQGIPAGATLVGAYFEHQVAPQGVLKMVVEHPDWPDTADGAQYPGYAILFAAKSLPGPRMMAYSDRKGQQYAITKEFTFAAAHHLEGLPDTHQCSRPHGHNYTVKVELQAPILNEVGFVVDYGDLKPLKDYIDQTLDHRDLNEVFSFQTSAENLAHHFYDWCHDRWPQVVAVHVSETAKTWATYYRGY